MWATAWGIHQKQWNAGHSSFFFPSSNCSVIHSIYNFNWRIICSMQFWDVAVHQIVVMFVLCACNFGTELVLKSQFTWVEWIKWPSKKSIFSCLIQLEIIVCQRNEEKEIRQQEKLFLFCSLNEPFKKRRFFTQVKGSSFTFQVFCWFSVCVKRCALINQINVT